MMKKLPLLTLLLLTACGAHDPWQAQDNTIHVVQTADGLVPLGPACKPFDEETMDRMENDPMPQLGCATANNLAAQIVNPADLVRGELKPDSLDSYSGTKGAAAIQRYHEGKVYQPSLTPAVTEGGQ